MTVGDQSSASSWSRRSHFFWSFPPKAIPQLFAIAEVVAGPETMVPFLRRR